MTHAKIDTKQLLASVNIVDVINGYVPLTKKGKDHVGCCPFHEEQDGSFHVTESKQMYYCYGCQSGGDALDFVQQYLNVDFVKAAGHLGGGLIQDGSPTRQTITREPVASPYDQYTPVIPIPSHATPMRDGRKTVPIVNPSKEHAASSWQPSAVHTYHTADGGRYGYVLRAEVGGGKKITPAALWCRRDNNTEGYALMPFPEQRPLYNLHRISDRTDRQVVIVEGEKAADYGQRVLGDSQVVTTSRAIRPWIRYARF